MKRSVHSVWKSIPTLEGAGVRLKRAFGYHHVPRLDPFLMLDDFHSNVPADYISGFPWHPHRGIETISYIIEGAVEHGDSMGNRGTISRGDVQWMTAGSGIIHQEMPRGNGEGTLWGFQLWANLPASHKMMDPRYQEIGSSSIPVAESRRGVRVRVICGAFEGVTGPVTDIVTEPEYLDVTLSEGSELRHAIHEGHTAFAYVLEGAAFFDDSREPYSFEREEESFCGSSGSCRCDRETLVLYERKGTLLAITAGSEPVRFLLCTGKPIGEPVAWGGPIVMNTRQELRQAFDDYERGTFVRHR